MAVVATAAAMAVVGQGGQRVAVAREVAVGVAATAVATAVALVVARAAVETVAAAMAVVATVAAAGNQFVGEEAAGWAE